MQPIALKNSEFRLVTKKGNFSGFIEDFEK